MIQDPAPDFKDIGGSGDFLSGDRSAGEAPIALGDKGFAASAQLRRVTAIDTAAAVEIVPRMIG